MGLREYVSNMFGSSQDTNDYETDGRDGYDETDGSGPATDAEDRENLWERVGVPDFQQTAQDYQETRDLYEDQTGNDIDLTEPESVEAYLDWVEESGSRHVDQDDLQAYVISQTIEEGRRQERQSWASGRHYMKSAIEMADDLDQKELGEEAVKDVLSGDFFLDTNDAYEITGKAMDMPLSDTVQTRVYQERTKRDLAKARHVMDSYGHVEDPDEVLEQVDTRGSMTLKDEFEEVQEKLDARSRVEAVRDYVTEEVEVPERNGTMNVTEADTYLAHRLLKDAPEETYETARQLLKASFKADGSGERRTKRKGAAFLASSLSDTQIRELESDLVDDLVWGDDDVDLLSSEVRSTLEHQFEVEVDRYRSKATTFSDDENSD